MLKPALPKLATGNYNDSHSIEALYLTAMSYCRCRSKKIRCDGIRPCCSQCSSVGFECKTSDKLSRRAFPRGYTESLEERVRSLECEVRELKDLLDEKDEKIDMLSRLHSQSTVPPFQSSPRRSVSATSPGQPDKDDVFRMQQSPYLEGHGVTSHFSGTSGSKNFLGMCLDLYCVSVRFLLCILTSAWQMHSSRRFKKAVNPLRSLMQKSSYLEVFTYKLEIYWRIQSHGKLHRDSNRTK